MGATIDARTFREAMGRFLESLEKHRQELDSLNVFPVPDGDTGTNMLLTQRAVDEAVGGGDARTLQDLGQTVSAAALMGARGNSGVILSQILRGLCSRLCRGDDPGSADLAEALREAAEQAYRAVGDPVEGTMLTVISDAARAATGAAEAGGGSGDVAAAALEEGRRSLERTRDQLPALREAGVVDAGAKGIVLLLDSLASALRGEELSVEVGPSGPVGVGATAAADRVKREERFGYEVMYLLECQDDVVGELRHRLGTVGDSLVVVGGGGLFNIHVHTDEPGAAVEAGIEAGRPRGIRITSLDDQVAEACVADEARAVRLEEGPKSSRASCGVLAVTPGEGVAELFRSLGATVLEGGPGSNPSAGELAAAARAAGAATVILLPNHRNILPVAQQAAANTDGVLVVPTRSVPEGLAAAAAFNPDLDAEANAARAREAAERAISVEVASAVRDARTPAGPVRAGQMLGIHGGEVRAVGDDPVEVAVEVLRPLVEEEHEILTVLGGDGLDDLDGIRSALADAFPSLEVEAHRGGQPHYPLLIGLE